MIIGIYLTTIIDFADRKVVGWSLSEDMTTQNTVLKLGLMLEKKEILVMNLFFIQIEVCNTHQIKW